MRTVAFVPLGHLDEAGLLQHLQVTAEIAVGEAAELLEIGKGQALGMRHQRGQESEPRLLVDDAIESVIGKWRAVSLRHRQLRTQSGESWPSATGRRQKAGPWSRATACGSGSPASGP